MAAPTGDDFSGREWKDGDAHEILPNVFLGSMVRVTHGFDAWIPAPRLRPS